MYFMLITNKIEYTKPQNIKYINSNRKKKVLSKKPRFTVYDCESEQLLVRLEGAQLQGDSVGCSNTIAFQTSLHSKTLSQKQKDNIPYTKLFTKEVRRLKGNGTR